MIPYTVFRQPAKQHTGSMPVNPGKYQLFPAWTQAEVDYPYSTSNRDVLYNGALSHLQPENKTVEMVEEACRSAGLEIVERRPMFVLMNEPVDSTNGLLKSEYKLLGRVIRRVPPFGTVAGALMYPLELFLTSRLRESPATEIMICQKPT